MATKKPTKNSPQKKKPAAVKKAPKKKAVAKKTSTKKQVVAAPVETVAEAVLAEDPIVESIVAPPVVERSDAHNTAPQPSAKRFIVFVALAFFAFVGGAYAYFGVYLQTPDQLWKNSLKNMRDGLTAYADKKPQQKKGAVLSGNLKVTSPVAAEATLSGTVYESNSQSTLRVNVAGVKAALELRTIASSANTSPDVYVLTQGTTQFTPLLASNPGLAALVATLDGKWLEADHTLLSKVSQQAGLSSTGSALPSATDVQDAEKKVAKAMNERLFTDDQTKAVFVRKETVGKEDYNGRKSVHVRVQVNKQHLREFVVSLNEALKSSKLKNWLIGTSDGRDFEKAIGYDELLKKIDAAQIDASTADVWIDTGYVTVRGIRFYDTPNDKSSYTDIMFDYKGGDEYPFVVHSVAKNSGGTQDVRLGFTVNRVTDKLEISFKGTAADGAGKSIADASGSISLTPSDKKIDVKKPNGAINISTLLGGILGQVQGAQTLKVINPANSSFLDQTVR